MSARRLRLTRAQRLVRERDFRRVYREGNRARGDTMTVAVVENGLEHSRVGLSVGKKVWKSAVRRNRVRRVYREAFRLEQEDLPRGVDLVLIGARPRLDPDLHAARLELVRLAHKAHRRYLEKLASRRPEGAPEES